MRGPDPQLAPVHVPRPVAPVPAAVVRPDDPVRLTLEGPDREPAIDQAPGNDREPGSARTLAGVRQQANVPVSGNDLVSANDLVVVTPSPMNSATFWESADRVAEPIVPALVIDPGQGDRTNIGDRTNVGDRNNIGNRTNTGDRTSIGDRETNIGGREINNRPVNIGNDINVNINNQPTWANIDNNRVNQINDRSRNAIVNNGDRGNYINNHPERHDHWNNWGNDVRDNWDHHHHHNDWFHDDWWGNHRHATGGWHYHYHDHNHGWNDWWKIPTYTAAVSWFASAASQAVWSQPVYYDYGQGGNVYYENNVVYMDGEEICSTDDYAMSAATLATVEAPTSEEEAAAVEWMPLGTFAVTADEQDVDPSRVIQLAVSETAIISGTYYNIDTDEAAAVQGQVDLETQRVAFRVGDSDEIVVETGIYNLTQEEAPRARSFWH